MIRNIATTLRFNFSLFHALDFFLLLSLAPALQVKKVMAIVVVILVVQLVETKFKLN